MIRFVQMISGWKEDDDYIEPDGRLLVTRICKGEDDDTMIGVGIQRTVNDQWPEEWCAHINMTLEQARKFRDGLNRILGEEPQ